MKMKTLGTILTLVVSISVVPVFLESAEPPKPPAKNLHEELFRIVCGEPHANGELTKYVQFTKKKSDPKDDARYLRGAAYDNMLKLFGFNCSSCGLYPVEYPYQRTWEFERSRDELIAEHMAYVCAWANVASNLVKDGLYFGAITEDLANDASCTRCGNTRLPQPELSLGYSVTHFWAKKLEYAQEQEGRVSQDFFHYTPALGGKPVDIRETRPRLLEVLKALEKS